MTTEEQYVNIDKYWHKKITYKFDWLLVNKFKENESKEDNIKALRKSFLQSKPLHKLVTPTDYNFTESELTFTFNIERFLDGGLFYIPDNCKYCKLNDCDQCTLDGAKNKINRDIIRLKKLRIPTGDDAKCIFPGCWAYCSDISMRNINNKETLFCETHLHPTEGEREGDPTEMLNNYKIYCANKSKRKYKTYLEFLKNPLPSEIKLLDADNKPVILKRIQLHIGH